MRDFEMVPKMSGGVGLIKRKLHVVHITNYFPPFGGGTETQAYIEAKFLLEHGHKVDVICLRPSEETLVKLGYNLTMLNDWDKASLGLQGCEIYNIIGSPPQRIFFGNLKTRYDSFFLPSLRNVIEEIEKKSLPDVYEIHQLFHAMSIPSDRKIVYARHEWESFCPIGGFPISVDSLHKKILDQYFMFKFNNNCSYHLLTCRRCVGIAHYIGWKLRRFLNVRRIDGVIVKKPYMKHMLGQCGINKEKIFLIPHWIDIDNITKLSSNGFTEKFLQKKLGSSFIKPPVFAFLGRLEDSKNPLLAFEGFEIFSKSNQEGILIFIGTGAMHQIIKEGIKKAHLEDRVFALGGIEHQNVFKIFGNIDIFIHTQRWTNYGWALLETMASGKSIIATDSIETRQIIQDGINGLLVPHMANSIAEAMSRLANDKNLRQNLGMAAQKTIYDKHSLENLETYEKVLLNLCG